MDDMKENSPDLKQVLRDLLGIELSGSAMARLLSSHARPSLWGLIVLDGEGSLHFVSFRQKNWVSDLLSASENDEGPLRSHECYRRDEISSLHREKRGFLSSLFNPSFRYALFLKGREEPVHFELENPEPSLLNALNDFPVH